MIKFIKERTSDFDIAPATDAPHLVCWIGAAISAATTIAGMISKSRAAQKEAEQNQSIIDKQNREAANLYQRRMNQDETQRSTVRSAITKGVEELRRGVKAVEGANAVAGGTNAKVAAAQESMNEAHGNMIAQAAIAGDARKDAIEDRYVNQTQTLANQQTALNTARSQAKQENVDNAVAGVNQVASSYEASNYDHGVRTPQVKSSGIDPNSAGGKKLQQMNADAGKKLNPVNNMLSKLKH